MTRNNLWRPGAWLLAAALLLAQQLGVMHRISHGPGSTIGVDVAAAATAANPDTVDASGWVTSLFTGHGDAGCGLFDAHGQGAAPSVPVLLLPAVIAVGVIGFFQLATISVAPAPFQARGPPPLR